MWKQASGNTPMWDFSEHKTIEGKYVSGRKVKTNKGESMIYTLNTKSGSFGMWGSAVLDRAFTEIPSGALVKITYNGKANGKNGVQFKDYEVLYNDENLPVIHQEEQEEPEEEEISIENIPF